MNYTGCDSDTVTPLVQYYCSKGVTVSLSHPVNIDKHTFVTILAIKARMTFCITFPTRIASKAVTLTRNGITIFVL